ncbi:MAG: S58 family peptidase [Candidatus Eremiobacteraeota bacterium]|uniref:Aminopeptidase DmpA (Serine peptidase, MEROPS family S58) n=1 Tax=mine drainage metagenome TaxID=410659 RepID=E6PDP7_9ZZZZ|nr:S58 family peptidase [Candidatus Eremiobacteraeota bacterium]
MSSRTIALAALLAALLAAPAAAALPFHVGSLPSGPLDGITDVAGVRVANLTIERGSAIRTGATAILPDADPWDRKLAAAFLRFNGNGEMTGTHWIDESGYLEEPIVLTDTLDIGLADDGVVSWMISKHPQLGITDDVPLPVVAECDDQLLNDIQARAVRPSDVVALLNRAHTGQFQRGSVGAGTGMKAFGFKAGIGSASRVLPASMGGYRVGVLVNDNTGMSHAHLKIAGVPVGRALQHLYLPKFPQPLALHGRMSSGSIIIVIATDAPLDNRQLRALALRAGMGMARTGLISSVGSGDLFVAFSTRYVYRRTGDFRVHAPRIATVESDRVLDTLYRATSDAVEASIDDALWSSTTMVGRRGITVYGLPHAPVLRMLQAAGVKLSAHR